ncbi:MAG TPA: acetoacetyl-CoA synthase [Gammaproteobacteria bacterium]|nr:acetoacetyl-CoA synthase [Gammaproteobacteria bacterium]
MQYPCRKSDDESLQQKSPPPKPSNASINSELLSKAREMNSNLSATSVVRRIEMRQRERWLQENAKAIQINNDVVEEGFLGDGIRRC